MKLFIKRKDGGQDSNTTGYFLLESKKLLTIAFLEFKGKSREVFHSHAFHCLGWVISGGLKEVMKDGRAYYHKPSILPFFVGRRDYHQVSPTGESALVFTIRGPWTKTWLEAKEDGSDEYSLSNGRVRTQ